MVKLRVAIFRFRVLLCISYTRKTTYMAGCDWEACQLEVIMWMKLTVFQENVQKLD